MMNNNQQKTPGLNCPQCGAFIPTSIPELLYSSGLHCMHCGLTLTINRNESKRAMEILKKRKRCTAKPEQGKFFPTINTIDYGRWT